MSTIPSRISNINEIIENINRQTLKPNKIFLNIPHNYKRFKDEVIKDKDLENIKYENLEILRCEDFGPGTKIMGSLKKVREYDCVIILDDDHLYDENICQIFLDAFKKEQIKSIVGLSNFLIKKYKIKSTFILGHSDISPDRKIDPGEKFPWKYLAKKKNWYMA